MRSEIIDPGIPLSTDNAVTVVSGAYTLTLRRETPNEAHFTLSSSNQAGDLAIALPLADVNGSQVLASDAIVSIEKQNDSSGCRVSIAGNWRNLACDFEIVIRTYTAYPGLFRWTVNVQPSAPISMTHSGQDVLFLDLGSGELIAAKLVPYAQQQALAVGVCYAYDPEVTASTLLYWQDFSSIMDCFAFAERSPKDTVRIGDGLALSASWNDTSSRDSESLQTVHALGFLPPLPVLLPPNRRTCIRDAYLYLQPGEASGNLERSKRFVQMMGTIYGHIQKPQTEYTDWNTIAHNTAEALRDPGNWIEKNGKSFICPYVHSGLQTDFPHSAVL